MGNEILRFGNHRRKALFKISKGKPNEHFYRETNANPRKGSTSNFKSQKTNYVRAKIRSVPCDQVFDADKPTAKWKILPLGFSEVINKKHELEEEYPRGI